MLDYEEIVTSLVRVFRPVLSLGQADFPLIQVPSNYASPECPYASLQLINQEDPGPLETGCIFDDGQAVRQDKNITIRIQTFGSKAFTRASKLKTVLEFPSMTGDLHEIGLCWRSTTPVRNISLLVTSSFEERAVFDVRLGTAVGNFEETAIDVDNEGLPSTGAFDEDIVPVERVPVDLFVDDSPETTGDEKLISSQIIT